MAEHPRAGLFRPGARTPSSGPRHPGDLLHRRAAHARRGARRVLRPGVLEGRRTARPGAFDPHAHRRRHRARMERAHGGSACADHAPHPPWQLSWPADGVRQRRLYPRAHAHRHAAHRQTLRRGHGLTGGTRFPARHRLAPAHAGALERLPPGAVLIYRGRGPIRPHPTEESMSGVSALKSFALALAFVASPVAVHAQGLVTTQKLSAQLANQLVGDSVANCAQKGYKVVAVVVDLDGVRQALLRGDGAPIHSMDNAYYKAYTIASLGLARKEETTKAIADRMAKNAPSTVPQTPLPNVTYAQGAIAIVAGGQTIGGLGVSGAPGGNLDEDCARAALEKIKERMK